MTKTDMDLSELLAKHDQVEAMALADRIVVLRAGRIEQIGRPVDLCRRPANLFVARFIGSPAMNILPGTVVADERGTGVSLSTSDRSRATLPTREWRSTTPQRPLCMG